MSLNGTYQQLLDVNSFIRKWADSFYYHCTTRTVQESKLYPINPYIELSYLNAFYRYPALFRRLVQVASPEELGDRARLVSSKANIITTHLAPMFYLSGRQMLIEMGIIKPTDAVDDVMEMIDFSERLLQAFNRNHAHVAPSDANFRAQLLPERQVQVFTADALGCTPGDRLHAAVRGFLAQASQYSFLSHCESRLGLNNSGPYRVGQDKEMLVRDFVDMGEGDFPWLDGIAHRVSHNHLTMTVLMKDTHINMIDDWGSFEATPGYDHDKMVAVGLYTSDYLSDGYIPVAMDDADTLAEFLENETETLRTATAELWKVMAEWTRDQMLDAGLLVYYSVPKDLFHIGAIYDQDDWFLVDERVHAFKPLMNDEYAGSLLGEMLGFVSLPSQQGPEHVMAKHNDSRSHIFSSIPYSLLSGAPFTSHVTETVQATTSLSPKQSGWSTTRGVLELDEANKLAASFSPAEHDVRFRYLDDGWLKYHSATPEAEELYRLTQRNSRLLEGKGAGLLMPDINELRKTSGQPVL